MKMTEQYINAMDQILGSTKLVVLPKNGADEGVLNPKTVAGALTLYKELLGNSSVREAISSSGNPKMLDEL